MQALYSNGHDVPRQGCDVLGNDRSSLDPLYTCGISGTPGVPVAEGMLL